MFSAPRASSPRLRSASCSIDDQSSIKDRTRKLFQRYYTHDLSTSSHSLATTNSHHDDLSPPLAPTHVSHTTSAQSTPMTSPSTGYSSLFPGSLSSATSESMPSADSKNRSEFGILMPASSSAYSPIHGSASSRSSHPVSPWCRSTTESDPQTSTPQILHNLPLGHLSDRPLTAPSSPPIQPILSNADGSPADHHTRSHSRLTVNIKNLFTRRALPSPSRFSFSSATTTPPDSETSSSSFQVSGAAGKWSMTSRKSRPPDLECSGSVAPTIPSPGRSSSNPVDIHRRYASEAAARICNARAGSGLPTSQQSLDVSSRNVPAARGRDPKTRNVLRRRPSGSAKLLKGRERGMSSPSYPSQGDTDHLGLSSKAVPFPLTPAGAVVEAYKQQELHRDELPSPPKVSIDDGMSSAVSHDGGCDRDPPERSSTPCYTVFGSEPRVQAGGPIDRFGKLDADQRIIMPSQSTSLHQPSMSDPGGRSLTRKISNRWRKVKGGGGVAPDDSPLRDKGHTKGRPSLQEIYGGDKSTSRLAGTSMDGPSNLGNGAWASPSAGHARSGSKGEKSEGPKLWKLMRRISTGGLRDRFQSDKVAPPVPAIPKELLKKGNQGERRDDPAGSRDQPSPLSADKDQSQTFRNMTSARPSAATSSPNSSDVASTQFFHRTHSARSSISSYGEAVALRIPEAKLNRHIITPLEQLRLGDKHAESGESSASRSPRRSTSVPAGLKSVEDGEAEQVPLPSPRHQASPGESSSTGSSRRCSTSPSGSGSARGSYQNPGALLGRHPRMADGTVSLSPPPRPPRSSARGAGGSAAGSPPQSMVVRQGEVGSGSMGARSIDRMPSGQSDMTARIESPDPGRSRDSDATAQAHAQLTFRELNGPRRPPLSEREKADIWDDLLARSDKAGGTLHINGAAGLLSDNMRFSTHSEI